MDQVSDFRFKPDEVVGVIAHGTISRFESHLTCRVQLHNCDGSPSEEISVPLLADEAHGLHIGSEVWVRIDDGKPTGLQS